jgi:hypothetical protein
LYRWELDGPARQEFAELPPAARASLAAFMDAVMIVDPLHYQRRRDERDDVSMPLRSHWPFQCRALTPAELHETFARQVRNRVVRLGPGLQRLSGEHLGFSLGEWPPYRLGAGR